MVGCEDISGGLKAAPDTHFVALRKQLHKENKNNTTMANKKKKNKIKKEKQKQEKKSLVSNVPVEGRMSANDKWSLIISNCNDK